MHLHVQRRRLRVWLRIHVKRRRYRQATTDDMDPTENVFCQPCPQGRLHSLPSQDAESLDRLIFTAFTIPV